MAFRNLFYIRCVLFLTLLLIVLYSPELRVSLGAAVGLLAVYACLHGALFWSLTREKVPSDWGLYAVPADIFMIAAGIYASSGVEVNLYIAYFVVIIGALLMESLVSGFFIAGIACAFYGVTVAITPEAFKTSDNLLRFVLLTTASFFIAYVSSLVHAKRKALAGEAEKRALWKERLAASRRLLGEVQGHVSEPLERIAVAVKELGGQGKSSDILWELDGIRGQLKRMGGVLGLQKAEPTPLELSAPLERALFKLQEEIAETGCEIDFPPPPPALVNGIKEHLAEFFCGLIKDVLAAAPKKGRIVIATGIKPAPWWERSERLSHWLTVEVSTQGGSGGSSRPGAAAGSGVDDAEWILADHGGRLDSRPAPGGSVFGYRVSLPVCGFPEKARAEV